MNKIEYLNNHILTLKTGSLLGLGNGKMGICLIFFHLYKIKRKLEYKKRGEKLLNEIIEEFSKEISKYDVINIEEGILGIAVGIHHLYKEKFIKGDINDILGDIDDIIFKRVAFMKEHFHILPQEEAHYLLYYLCLRYKNQKNEANKFIYNELIITTLEFIYNNLTEKLLKEPLCCTHRYFLPIFLYSLAEVISLNIYNYRIYQIVQEFETDILGTIPKSHSNRLFLLWGLMHLNNSYTKKSYLEHINLLKTQINLNRILYNEFSNKQIFLNNGTSLIALLLFDLKKTFQYAICNNDITIIYKKILRSEIWDTLEQKNNYGLLGGIYTPLLILNLIRVYR